jgi:hypothetical protein
MKKIWQRSSGIVNMQGLSCYAFSLPSLLLLVFFSQGRERERERLKKRKKILVSIILFCARKVSKRYLVVIVND